MQMKALQNYIILATQAELRVASVTLAFSGLDLFLEGFYW